MAALVALSLVAAQSRRAAGGDGPEDLLLSGAETSEVPRVLAHDVGEFHAAWADRLSDHDYGYLVVGPRLAKSGRRSSGLWVPCK